MSHGGRHLDIYLNDHIAGAAAGLELAKSARDANEGTGLGAFLEKLCIEIEEDKQTLEDVIDQLGIRRHALKEVAGWLLEKASRLKIVGPVGDYTDLSRLIQP